MKKISFVILGGALAWASPASAQLEPFIGQTMVTGAVYCPVGWLAANGQILPVGNGGGPYDPLAALLGNNYGGNGSSTFALPKIRPVVDANGVTLLTCIAYQGTFPSRP